MTAGGAVGRLGRADQVVLRLAAALVRLACRRLPEPERTERRREWTAELYGPLTDPDLRWVRRAWVTVLYAADQQRTIRALPGTHSQLICRLYPDPVRPVVGGVLSIVSGVVSGGVVFGIVSVLSGVGGVLSVVVGIVFSVLSVLSILGVVSGVLSVVVGVVGGVGGSFPNYRRGGGRGEDVT